MRVTELVAAVRHGISTIADGDRILGAFLKAAADIRKEAETAEQRCENAAAAKYREAWEVVIEQHCDLVEARRDLAEKVLPLLFELDGAGGLAEKAQALCLPLNDYRDAAADAGTESLLPVIAETMPGAYRVLVEVMREQTAKHRRRH